MARKESVVTIRINGKKHRVSPAEAREIRLVQKALKLRAKMQLIRADYKEVADELIDMARNKQREKNTVHLGEHRTKYGLQRLRIVFARRSEWIQHLLWAICEKHSNEFLKYFKSEVVYSPRPELDNLLNNPSKREEAMADAVRKAIAWKSMAPSVIFEHQEPTSKNWKPIK